MDTINVCFVYKTKLIGAAFAIQTCENVHQSIISEPPNGCTSTFKQNSVFSRYLDIFCKRFCYQSSQEHL